MADQIGLTGQAGFWGVTPTTVAWSGGTGSHSLTIFSEISKTSAADIDPSIDNEGERMGQNRRNKRRQVRFSAHPKGTDAAAALAIAADLPMQGDTATLTCAGDGQIAADGDPDTCLVDEATSRYTPEGELVVDFTVTIWIGKKFVALS